MTGSGGRSPQWFMRHPCTCARRFHWGHDRCTLPKPHPPFHFPTPVPRKETKKKNVARACIPHPTSPNVFLPPSEHASIPARMARWRVGSGPFLNLRTPDRVGRGSSRRVVHTEYCVLRSACVADAPDRGRGLGAWGQGCPPESRIACDVRP